MIYVELGKDDLFHAQAAGSGRPRQQKHLRVRCFAGCTVCLTHSITSLMFPILR